MSSHSIVQQGRSFQHGAKPRLGFSGHVVGLGLGQHSAQLDVDEERLAFGSLTVGVWDRKLKDLCDVIQVYWDPTIIFVG